MCCRSPSKTCVSAYYYPVPATGLTLGRMVLTLAFECWVFADYLPSSFVRGRLASLTSRAGDSLASNRFRRTAHVCLGAIGLFDLSSLPWVSPCSHAVGASSDGSFRSPRTNSPPLHAKSHTPTCPAGRAGDHRPDSLAPLPALFAPRPLRDMPVDHHEADRLLGQVVRRFYPRRGDEREIGVSVLARTASPCSGRAASAGRTGPTVLPCRAPLSAGGAETPPCCVARVDGTPRTASSVPPAMLRRSCGRAGPAASSENSHHGSDGPDRTARGCRTSSCSGDRPRSNRSRECRQTPRPTCSSAPRRYGGHRCDTRYTTRHGNTRSTSGSLLQRCPVSSTLRISSSGSSSSNSS